MKTQVAEGMKIPFDGIDKIRTELLSIFPLKDIKTNQKITTISPEFSAVCPFSGLPDIATLIISYIPNQIKPYAVELKSLKYYTLSFRNVGIYQEDVTDRIFDDLKAVLDPELLIITTKYMVRGGFTTVCTRKGVRNE